MNGFVRGHRFLGFSLVIVSLAALQGCAGHEEETAGKRDETAIGWDSPRLRELEEEWRSIWDDYGKVGGPGGKVRYVETVQSVDRLFQKRFSRQDLRQMAASADTVPIHPDDRSPFVNEMLAFMVKAFVSSGDRESLVGLLSKRCPSRIDGPELIEFYLTFRGKRLKDPILILGEAYAVCGVPETRHLLAAAARRSFAEFGIRGNDDAGFVSNAMRWYEQEKDGLVVNQGYTLNETSHGGSFTLESYERNPEFYDNPPGVRDPLFKRSAGPPGGDRIPWLLLTLTTVTAGVMVALFTMRAKARRAKEDSRPGTHERPTGPRSRGGVPVSGPSTDADLRAHRGRRASWLFAAIGAGCGGLAFAFLGAVVGREDWSPPLGAGDQRTFILLTALTGVFAGAVIGLAVRVGTMRGLSLAGRMAAWGALGGWLVLLLFSTLCFKDPPRIGGPVIYGRGAEGFWDRLVDAVIVPLAYGPWIFVALGAIVAAVAPVGWWLLCAVIHKGLKKMDR